MCTFGHPCITIWSFFTKEELKCGETEDRQSKSVQRRAVQSKQCQILEKRQIFNVLLLEPKTSAANYFWTRGGRPWLSCRSRKRPDPPPRNRSLIGTGTTPGTLHTIDRYCVLHSLLCNPLKKFRFWWRRDVRASLYIERLSWAGKKEKVNMVTIVVFTEIKVALNIIWIIEVACLKFP